MVVLYSSSHCGRCRAVKIRLQHCGISFEERLLENMEQTEVQELTDRASKVGGVSLPILERDGDIVTLEELTK